MNYLMVSMNSIFKFLGCTEKGLINIQDFESRRYFSASHRNPLE
jgi:hypothetical protein